MAFTESHLFEHIRRDVPNLGTTASSRLITCWLSSDLHSSMHTNSSTNRTSADRACRNSRAPSIRNRPCLTRWRWSRSPTASSTRRSTPDC